MFKENDECCAIQCEKCGGTMYSDAASTSFICSFCGSKEPWPNSENILDSEIKYRHKPVEVVNGLVKLGHVYFMEPLPEMLKTTPKASKISWAFSAPSAPRLTKKATPSSCPARSAVPMLPVNPRRLFLPANTAVTV